MRLHVYSLIVSVERTVVIGDRPVIGIWSSVSSLIFRVKVKSLWKHFFSHLILLLLSLNTTCLALLSSLPVMLGLFLLLFEVGADFLVGLLDLLSQNLLHFNGVGFFKLIGWQLLGTCSGWACSITIASLRSKCVRVINEMSSRDAWSRLIWSLWIWPVSCLLVAGWHKHSWVVASSHWWRCL